MAQVLPELPGSNQPLILSMHSVSQSPSRSLRQAGLGQFCSAIHLLGTQCEKARHTVLLSYCLWARSVRQAGCTVPLSYSATGHPHWNLPQGMPATAESSSQSSCLPSLTSTWLFTHSNFPASPKTIWIRVRHGPTPSFSRCHPAPQFLWCLCPQSQWMYTTSVCLPVQL